MNLLILLVSLCVSGLILLVILLIRGGLVVIGWCGVGIIVVLLKCRMCRGVVVLNRLILLVIMIGCRGIRLGPYRYGRRRGVVRRMFVLMVSGLGRCMVMSLT